MSASAAVRLLIVDDEPALLEALSRTLRLKGFLTTGANSPARALELLRDALRDGAPFDVLITDLAMPGADGIELMRAAQQIDPELVSILMTGHGSIDTAVEAMKSGALDYILKPFNHNVIVPAVTRAGAVRRLRLENSTLLRRVAERTAELEAANAELRAANRELDAFAASVAHDLRQPLLALNGFSDLLLSEDAGALNAAQKQYLGEVRAGGHRMFALTEDLLRFARLGKQPLSSEDVDAGAVASALVEEMRGAEPARDIDVRIGSLPVAHADPVLFRQVLANLLGNAFKFTRKVVHPVVELNGWTDERMAYYSVRDNGAGFDMRHADQLFRLFRRLHDAKAFEGTGVGLSIVQRIVERHGGRIRAEARPGEGACFTFGLPRRQADAGLGKM